MLSDSSDYPKANSIIRDAGYSAPYLHLLDDEDSSTSPRLLSSYSKKKLKEVTNAIRSGAGQGSGDGYKPWLRIRRNFSSPVSYQVFSSVGINERNHHFLSQLEFHTALICSFAGARELRECLPLWPGEHPHPGFFSYESAPIIPGLLEISREIGVDHGCYVGTSVPYIASLDLAFRPPNGGRHKLSGISCKPKTITEKSTRAKERVELDMQYCRVIDAHHLQEDGSSIDPITVAQLRWLAPLTSEIREYQQKSQLIDFSGIFSEISNERPISHTTADAGRKVGLNLMDAYRFFRIGVWLHHIDLDITRLVDMTKPRIGDGGRMVSHWRMRYFGAQA